MRHHALWRPPAFPSGMVCKGRPAVYFTYPVVSSFHRSTPARWPAFLSGFSLIFYLPSVRRTLTWESMVYQLEVHEDT